MPTVLVSAFSLVSLLVAQTPQRIYTQDTQSDLYTAPDGTRVLASVHLNTGLRPLEEQGEWVKVAVEDPPLAGCKGGVCQPQAGWIRKSEKPRQESCLYGRGQRREAGRT